MIVNILFLSLSSTPASSSSSSYSQPLLQWHTAHGTRTNSIRKHEHTLLLSFLIRSEAFRFVWKYRRAKWDGPARVVDVCHIDGTTQYNTYVISWLRRSKKKHSSMCYYNYCHDDNNRCTHTAAATADLDESVKPGTCARPAAASSTTTAGRALYACEIIRGTIAGGCAMFMTGLANLWYAGAFHCCT